MDREFIPTFNDTCRYNIKKTSKNFVVNLDVSVCMEAIGGCQMSKTIFKNTIIPIPICNLDAELAIKSESPFIPVTLEIIKVLQAL